MTADGPGTVAMVLLAGALGAALRWGVLSWQKRYERSGRPARGSRSPESVQGKFASWGDGGLVLVNVAGSFVAGFALGAAPLLPPGLVLVVVVGLCGGLTTFGTLMVSAAEELRSGRGRRAMLTLSLHIVLGLAAALLGLPAGASLV